MIKIIVPIILFFLIIYGVSNYWNKANVKNKKTMALVLGVGLASSLIATTFFVID